MCVLSFFDGPFSDRSPIGLEMTAAWGVIHVRASQASVASEVFLHPQRPTIIAFGTSDR